MEPFGARAEKRKVLVQKMAADVLPLSLLSGLLPNISFFSGECNTGVRTCGIYVRTATVFKTTEDDLLHCNSLGGKNRYTVLCSIGYTELLESC